jgi:hypothetical protein
MTDGNDDTTLWPYPPFSDERWLVTPGPDPALRAVVAATRRVVEQTGRNGSPLRAIAALRDRIDWAMLALVGEAHAAGASWAEIGAALGISKQAAHKRFAPYVEQAIAAGRANRPESR